jgi:hypothetical protein
VTRVGKQMVHSPTLMILGLNEHQANDIGCSRTKNSIEWKYFAINFIDMSMREVFYLAEAGEVIA